MLAVADGCDNGYSIIKYFGGHDSSPGSLYKCLSKMGRDGLIDYQPVAEDRTRRIKISKKGVDAMRETMRYHEHAADALRKGLKDVQAI